jgi:hypothetical protein
VEGRVFSWHSRTFMSRPPALDYISITPGLGFQHELRTPGEKIVFTELPKVHSHSQIFRYGRIIFCLPHQPKFSDFFDLCLHWVSVVRGFSCYTTLSNWKVNDKCTTIEFVKNPAKFMPRGELVQFRVSKKARLF